MRLIESYFYCFFGRLYGAFSTLIVLLVVAGIISFRTTTGLQNTCVLTAEFNGQVMIELTLEQIVLFSKATFQHMAKATKIPHK